MFPEFSYRQLVKNLKENIFELGFDGVILYANHEMDEVPEEDLIGKNIFTFINRDDASRLQQLLTKIEVGSSGEGCSLELQLRAGSRKKMDLLLAPLPEEGNPNRTLILFSELKNSEERLDLLIDPHEIREVMLKALLEIEILELQLDSFPESFSCVLLPFPPNGAPVGLGGGANVFPGDYLSKMTHLLVSPVEPAYGNLKIRHARNITLVLHDGVLAKRGEVSFLEPLSGENGHALKLSFPKRMEIFPMRKIKRIRVPSSFHLRGLVQPDEGDPFEALIADISVAGLSYYNPKAIPPLAVESTLKISLSSKYAQSLELFGMVCSVTHARSADNTSTTHARCGVELFPIADEKAENNLKLLVDQVEKNHRYMMENKRRLYKF